MGKHGRKKRRTLPDAEAVLTGKVRASIEELFHLIHDVNPTGWQLTSEEETRRYGVKSALQSFLIEHHADHLVVEPTPNDPRLVTLRHHHNRRDACHAKLDALTPEARSWIRWQLDVAAQVEEPNTRFQAVDRTSPPEDSEEPAPAPPDTLDARTLLERGMREWEAYEFLEAAQSFTHAIEQARTEGDTVLEERAARKGLELHVDILMDDEGALALAGKLTEGLAHFDALAPFLALALARTGRADEATARLASVQDDERRTAIVAALALHAISRSDLDSARRHLESVPPERSGHPEVQAAHRAVREAKQALARCLEDEWMRLRESPGDGTSEELDRRARQLLDLDPDNTVARDFLRDRRDRARDREVAALRHRLENLIESRFWRGARTALEALKALGCPVETDEACVRAGESEDVRGEEERRIDESIAAFEHEARDVALLRFLNLPATLRSRVRARIDVPDLDWLDEVPKALLHHADKLVGALIALDVARCRLEAGNLDEARRTIAPHADIAKRTPTGMRLFEDIARAERGQRLELMQSAWECARRAIDEGRLAQAHEILEEAAPPDAPDELRAVYGQLVMDLARADEIMREATRYETYRERGDLPRARCCAERLATLCSGSKAAHWNEQTLELERELRDAWAYRRFENEVGVDFVSDWKPQFHEDVPMMLSSDGATLRLVVAHERWLIVRQWKRTTGRVHEGIAWRAPASLGENEIVFDTNGIWILGSEGKLLQLSPDARQVLRWLDLAPSLPEHEELLTFLPIGQRIWISVHSKTHSFQTVLLDMEDGHAIANWDELRVVGTSHRASGPERVVCSRDSDGIRLFDAHRGTSYPSRSLSDARINNVTKNPNGGFVALGSSDPDVDEHLTLFGCSEDGEVAWSHPIEDTSPIHTSTLAMSRDGTIHVTARFMGSTYVLVYRLTNQGFEEVLRRPIGAMDSLVSDPGQGTIRLLRTTTNDLVLMDPMAGDADTLKPVQRIDHPHLGYFCCSALHTPDPDDERARRAIDELEIVAFEHRIDAIWARIRMASNDPDALCTLLEVIKSQPFEEPKTTILERLRAIEELPPAARLALGLDAAARGSWEEVVTWCSHDLPDRPSPAHIHARCHALSLALIHLGRFDEAFATLEQMPESSSHCTSSEDLIDLIRLAKTPPTDLPPDDSSLAWMLHDLHEAAAAIREDRSDDALRSLETRRCWSSQDRRVYAHRAACHLRHEATDHVSWFRKVLALATFLEWADRQRPHTDPPVLPHVSEEDLRSIQVRARAWLDQPDDPVS